MREARDEFDRLLGELPSLTPDDYRLIGQRWRTLAFPHPSGSKPDVNTWVAAALRAADYVMEARRLLEALSPEKESPVPVPADDEFFRAMRGGAEARDAAASHTADDDAQQAIGGLGMVLLLRSWIPGALFDNVAGAFNAARPGFFESPNG
jgi:hypothetical protein